jgi:hypothetical protein
MKNNNQVIEIKSVLEDVLANHTIFNNEDKFIVVNYNAVNEKYSDNDNYNVVFNAIQFIEDAASENYEAVMNTELEDVIAKFL